MLIEPIRADTVQNTGDYWATTGRLLATTVRFSSSRRRLRWYLQDFVSRHGEKCCKYQEGGRRLLGKHTVVDSSRPVVGQ